LTNRRIPPNDGAPQNRPPKIDVRARRHPHLAVEVDRVPLAQLPRQQIEHGALIARHAAQVGAALVGGTVEGEILAVLGGGRGPAQLARLG